MPLGDETREMLGGSHGSNHGPIVWCDKVQGALVNNFYSMWLQHISGHVFLKVSNTKQLRESSSGSLLSANALRTYGKAIPSWINHLNTQEFVREGNLMCVRTTLIMWLQLAVGIMCILEQPCGSLFEEHPRFKQLCILDGYSYTYVYMWPSAHGMSFRAVVGTSCLQRQ